MTVTRQQYQQHYNEIVLIRFLRIGGPLRIGTLFANTVEGWRDVKNAETKGLEGGVFVNITAKRDGA